MKRNIKIGCLVLMVVGLSLPLWAQGLNSLVDPSVVYEKISAFYGNGEREFFSPPQVEVQSAVEDVQDETEEVEEPEQPQDTEEPEQPQDTKEPEQPQDTEEPEEPADLGIGEVPANYNPTDGTITYVDPNTGEARTVNIEDLGLTQEWLEKLLQEGGDLTVKLNEDGSIKLLVGYNDAEGGAKRWEYDPQARLAAHYEGAKGEERVTVITSDEPFKDYIWASPDIEDPGDGPDGHLVVQRFNYDENGNLESVEYFTWTAGDRAGQDKSRYCYRKDTISGDTIDIKYFNDPFPDDWDPVLTGTVEKDEYGRFWLVTDKGERYLLTFRVDGFDADQDGKSGAQEANEIDWESLVGKEITIRGHQLMTDSEGGIYYNGEKAEVLEVVDIITPEEKEQLEAEGKYDQVVEQMRRVAEAVDPVHQGLVAEEGQGELGFINLFDGQMPTPEQISTYIADYVNRLANAIAPLYRDNIDQALLEQIMQFAIPELQQALQAIQQPEQEPAPQPEGNPEGGDVEEPVGDNPEGVPPEEGETPDTDEGPGDGLDLEAEDAEKDFDLPGSLIWAYYMFPDDPEKYNRRDEWSQEDWEKYRSLVDYDEWRIAREKALAAARRAGLFSAEDRERLAYWERQLREWADNPEVVEYINQWINYLHGNGEKPTGPDPRL